MSTPQPAFRLVIEKNNVDESKLSKPIQGYIEDYNAIADGIADLEGIKEDNDGKLSVDDQRELEEFYTSLAEKDKDLVVRINKWIANLASSKERGKHMAQVNAQRKAAANGTPPAPAKTNPAPGTPPGPAPVPVKKENGANPGEYTPTEEIPAEDPKKDTSILGWLIGGAVVVIGVLIGVNLKNRQ